MKVHELKSDPGFFKDVASGRKSFEIRQNDRGYETGDFLYLRETTYIGYQIKYNQAPLQYTGRSTMVKVVYIMHGPRYGLIDGWWSGNDRRRSKYEWARK